MLLALNVAPQNIHLAAIEKKPKLQSTCMVPEKNHKALAGFHLTIRSKLNE
jgi:hypothetical protein